MRNTLSTIGRRLSDRQKLDDAITVYRELISRSGPKGDELTLVKAMNNLAKALLDAIKGYLFHDDAQVARLLVERREGERERITIRVFPRKT